MFLFNGLKAGASTGPRWREASGRYGKVRSFPLLRLRSGQALSRRARKDGAPVMFQEVVHSIETGAKMAGHSSLLMPHFRDRVTENADSSLRSE
jgi:hypothetical protein